MPILRFYFLVLPSRLTAVEEAVKSIQAVTIGPPKSAETLQTALALGADSAIHVQTQDSSPAPKPLAVAETRRAIKQGKYGATYRFSHPR